MKVLLVGQSSIARRRVLPALASLGVTHVDLATRGGDGELGHGLRGTIHRDYLDAVRRSDAALVYVSTVNSLHAPVAKAALEAGKHVVIDKPATLDLDDTRALIALAQRNGVLIAESTVWPFHPQVEAARTALAELGCSPARLSLQFCYPALPAGNFRHQAAFGGGALWDLGPYAVSAARVFLGASPEDVTCHATGGSDASPVDSGFAMLAAYPSGATAVGQFSSDAPYLNRIEILARGASITLSPAFTTPADRAATVIVRTGSATRELEVGPADSFAVFLRSAFDALRSGSTATFAQAMLADAEALHALRRAAFGAGGAKRRGLSAVDTSARGSAASMAGPH